MKTQREEKIELGVNTAIRYINLITKSVIYEFEQADTIGLYAGITERKIEELTSTYYGAIYRIHDIIEALESMKDHVKKQRK